jgi:hypothetical protein
MDVLYFLKKRTNFIRYFYETAAKPFRETLRKIYAGESSFDDPPYGEDGEPPFMEEWSKASTALDTLGRSCLSMLSASLQLYFKALESEVRVTWWPRERKNTFEKGLRHYFIKAFNASWGDCPANIDTVEQIILVRNRDQHPNHIGSLQVSHDRRTREKYELFFVSETEKKMFGDPELSDVSWMNPTVHVSHEALLTAIHQVEILSEWLENQTKVIRYRG